MSIVNECMVQRCANCDGNGFIEIPSMLGYGTEIVPCTCSVLSDEEKEQVMEDAIAEILRKVI